MITEHNYQKLYLLKAPALEQWLDQQCLLTSEEESARVFLHPKDAKGFRRRLNKVLSIVEIELPFRLEYDADVIWQCMRYYRHRGAALAGFDQYMKQAVGSSLHDCKWRVIDLATGDVVIEGRPDIYIFT